MCTSTYIYVLVYKYICVQVDRAGASQKLPYQYLGSLLVLLFVPIPTNTQIRKYTNTQKHKYTNTQIHKCKYNTSHINIFL